MNYNEIIDEIKVLKENVNEIVLKIDLLEKKISKNEVTFCNFMEKDGLSKSSISNYLNGLRKIKQYLKEYLNYNLDCEIYDNLDLEFVNNIYSLFYSSNEIKLINKRQHYFLSAALNEYIKYVNKMSYNDEFIIDE